MAKSQAKRGRPTGGQGEAAPRIGHLDSLSGILAEMKVVYREARLGKTKLDEATKLIYCLKEMRATVELLALEDIDGGRLNGHHFIEAQPD